MGDEADDHGTNKFPETGVITRDDAFAGGRPPRRDFDAAGLRIAIPSTPEDIAGLFWAAIQDDAPTLFLIPKHIFRVRQPVEAYRTLPFGKAAIRREGSDVTVVAWGNTLELAFQEDDHNLKITFPSTHSVRVSSSSHSMHSTKRIGSVGAGLLGV
jgi:hypothetical protein